MNEKDVAGPSRAHILAWAFAPVLILGSGLLGLGVMTALALDDPSFALEPNYYDKAIQLDARKHQEAQNRELGWELVLDSRTLSDGSGGVDLSVRLADADGLLEGAAVQVEAFHNARAADVRELGFESVGDGTYRARLLDVRPGLWELRFVVERQGIRFTSVQRRMLRPTGKT